MGRDEGFERYLNILGVADAGQDLASLRRLVRAQLTRVPFENVSKLYLARARKFQGVPPLERYLDGIEQCRFGGTCYANNYHVASLLSYVGFDASYCGADMESGQDVHAVVLVRLEGREYLVDVGYGAPFYEPMPRDRDKPLTIRLGRDRYVLNPRDERGRSRMEHHREGQPIHGYLAKPTARDLSFFDAVIRDSYRPSAQFMTQIRVSKFFDDGAAEIIGSRLVQSHGDHCTVAEIPNREALVDALVEEFGMPRGIVTEVVEPLAWPQ